MATARKWSLRRRAVDAAFEVLVGGRTRIRTGGLDLELPRSLVPATVRHRIRQGRYEAPEIAALADFIDPGLPILEFGGGLGLVALHANRLLRDPTRHVVVEMDPRLAALLERNRDRNGARFRVQQAALWYGGGPARVLRADTFLGDRAGHRDRETRDVETEVTPSGAGAAKDEGGDHGDEVPTTTAAQVLDGLGWDRINLILDVEGQEHEFFQREWPTLASRVRSLVIEVHPWWGAEQRAKETLLGLAGSGFAQHRALGLTHAYRW